MLLHRRHLYGRNLHAQVASGDHDTVRNLADGIDIIYTGSVFDLGYDIDILSAVGIQKFPENQDIIPCGNKRSRNEFNALFDTKENIGLILLTEEGLVQYLVGEVHALLVRQRPARHNGADSIVPGQLFYLEYHEAVIHQNAVTHLQVIDKSLVAYRYSLLRSLHLVCGKGKGISLLQLHLSILKCTDPVFRSFGIQHNGDGQVHVRPDLLDQIKFFFMLCVGTMGKIQSGQIHAGFKHFPERLFIIAGRSDGAHDLCFTHLFCLLPCQVFQKPPGCPHMLCNFH